MREEKRIEGGWNERWKWKSNLDSEVQLLMVFPNRPSLIVGNFLPQDPLKRS